MTILLSTTSEAATTPVFVQMLLVVGVIAIGLFLTMTIRGKISRRQAATLPPAERIAQVKKQRLTVQDEHAISASLHDVARRLAAQLDNKAERLEQLLAEADERIARLEQAIQSDPQPSHREPPPIETRPVAEAKELRLTRSEPEAEPEPVAQAPRQETLDPLTRSVYELADAGHESVSIARALDEQIGKVELILALRAS